jgi:hypothetical protein
MPHSFLKTCQKKGAKIKILGGVIAGITRQSQNMCEKQNMCIENERLYSPLETVP